MSHRSQHRYDWEKQIVFKELLIFGTINPHHKPHKPKCKKSEHMIQSQIQKAGSSAAGKNKINKCSKATFFRSGKIMGI